MPKNIRGQSCRQETRGWSARRRAGQVAPTSSSTWKTAAPLRISQCSKAAGARIPPWASAY